MKQYAVASASTVSKLHEDWNCVAVWGSTGGDHAVIQPGVRYTHELHGSYRDVIVCIMIHYTLYSVLLVLSLVHDPIADLMHTAGTVRLKKDSQATLPTDRRQASNLPDFVAPTTCKSFLGLPVKRYSLLGAATYMYMKIILHLRI